MPSRPLPGGARPLAAVALAITSLVGAAAVGSIFLTTATDSWAAISAAGPAGPADGILLVVALGGAALTLWLGLGTALAALSAMPGVVGQACSAMAARIAPVAVRKFVAFVLGTALTAALIPGTALARTDQQHPRQSPVASAQQQAGAASVLADAAPDASFRFVSDSVSNGDVAPSPSWSVQEPASVQGPQVTHPGSPTTRAGEHRPAAPTPLRPTAPAPRSQATPRGTAAPIELVSAGGGSGGSTAKGARQKDVESVVVLRGDSLWSIAARHLGGSATNAEIDIEWHRWFAANRQVIGNDPGIIAPGQLLTPPPPSPGQGNR